MAGDGEHGADGAAEREAAVRGEVGDIQDGKADEQRQRDEAVNKADLKRRLQNSQHGAPSFGMLDQLVKILLRGRLEHGAALAFKRAAHGGDVIADGGAAIGVDHGDAVIERGHRQRSGVLTVDQHLHDHVGRDGAELGVIHAVADKRAVEGKGIRAAVLRNLGIEELLIDGELGSHDGVVGRGEDGVDLLGDERVDGGGNFIGGGAGLFHAADALALEVGLRVLDRLLGGILALGVEQADGLGVRVLGEHQVEQALGVERVARAGDAAAGRVERIDNAGADGVRHGGEDDGDLRVLGGGLHDLYGRGRDRDDEVHALADELGADLVERRGVALTVVERVVKGHAQLRGLRVELGLDGRLDLVEGRIVHKLHDADLIGLAFGLVVLGLAAAGGQAHERGDGEHAADDLLESLIHNIFSFYWNLIIVDLRYSDTV